MFLTTENILPLRKKAERGLRPGVQTWPVLCEVKYLSCTTHTHTGKAATPLVERSLHTRAKTQLETS